MCAGINLLPGQRELYKKNKRIFCITVLLNSIILLSIFLAWYLILWQKLHLINKQIANLNYTLSKLAQKTPGSKKQQNNINENNFASHIHMITHNQNIFTNIFNNINKNIVTNMQLTQLSININQGKLFGTTEEITDIAKLLQDFMQSHYCINPMVEKIVRQNYRYSFVLSWSFKH